MSKTFSDYSIQVYDDNNDEVSRSISITNETFANKENIDAFVSEIRDTIQTDIDDNADDDFDEDDEDEDED